MKKLSAIIATILLLSTMLNACAGGVPDDGPTDTQPQDTIAPDSVADTTPAVPDTTPAVADTTTEPATTEPVPTETVKYLPLPYVDIEFGEDGSVYDAMEHVTCSLEDKSKGYVVNEPVAIDGKEYTFPHLYIRTKGGAVRLKYSEITSKTQLHDLLSGGLTLEAMVVNHNRFNSSSSEQAIAGTCQSGGYNLSCYKGAYTFSVYTGGAYRSAHNPTGVINDSMTHLIGVYDADAKTATLYVNGQKAVTVSADGTFGLASGNLWQQIILGGDIGNDFSTQLLSVNTRIADYKIYPAAMNESEAALAYEQMKVKLMGETVDYRLEYYEGEYVDEALGDRIFATLADSYADVYEPDSELVNSPTVMTYATKDNYSTLAATKTRPATLIFGVKSKAGTLYACDTAGNEIAPLRDAVKALNGKIIPAFAVNDAALATAMTEFINYHRIGDCFVISGSGELLSKICKATRSARPVLNMSDVTTLNIKQIRTEVSACGAKTVILKEGLLTAEDVTLLRASAHSVLLKTEDGKENVHDAIFKGAMGIVTEDYSDAIEIIESIKMETLCFPTLLVAHRGDMQNCPQNIMRSFISAAQSGAPIIELDVYLTTDKHLAINHDDKTTHWDKQLTCTESTREQLKALKNTESTATAEDTFTFLDEVFDYFSKNYTDMIIHVEIKDKREAVVDKVVELAKQYGMFDRVLIICNKHDIVRYASETYGASVQMIRSYIYDVNNVQASLAFACQEVVPLNSSYYTVWADRFDPLNVALRHRGIKYCTWTTTTASATDADYARGYVEFTSNTPHRCDGYAHYIKAEMDAAGNVKVTRVNYDGSTSDVTKDAKLVVISGDVTYKDGKVSGSGSFAFSYDTSVASYKYELRSLSITK